MQQVDLAQRGHPLFEVTEYGVRAYIDMCGYACTSANPKATHYVLELSGGPSLRLRALRGDGAIPPVNNYSIGEEAYAKGAI